MYGLIYPNKTVIHMKKLLIVLAIFLCVSEVTAQKEKKIYYYQKDSILYTQVEGSPEGQPFTGSLRTWCKNDGKCPPDIDKKKILLLPNLGIKEDDLDPLKETFSFFIQEKPGSVWKLCFFISESESGEQFDKIKTVVLDEITKEIIINSSKRFAYTVPKTKIL